MASTPTDRRPVAVLGTGMMGGGIARCLLRAGFPVRVYNRTPAKAAPLVELGATAHSSPATAAEGAGVLITMLLDADVVATAAREALPLLAPGAVWLQTSTVGGAIDDLAVLAAEHGVPFYDTPVVGPPRAAGEGRLGVLISGPRTDRLDPVLAAIGARTLWVGEGTEASRLKLAVNSWVLAVTLALLEAMALTESAGLDPQLFLDAIEDSPLGTAYARFKGGAVLAGDYAPTFSVRSALKDAELITAVGRATGASALVAEAVREQYRRAAELGHADKDLTAAFLAARAVRA
ncbi:NAD(P)-dependent oxidoreductase [Actinokineospora enzanensis]|uniref:NAD(P)-dependent oxidoreductase n=1 Tax=Actinokineospora enzanensis TaxID=155975 RepID=UPI0003746666|nr:NAD(P)-dependent oxidoreductase [Actinokineospora enzanensis]